jgi:hypothetical protein
MPQQEAFNLSPDGRVVPGLTVLRDPQTGQLYDIESVQSGRMPTPIDGRHWGGSSNERCALNGAGRIHSAQGRS